MQHISSMVVLFAALRSSITPYVMQKMSKNLKNAKKDKVMQNSIIVMLG
jgi:hypothetical protein